MKAYKHILVALDVSAEAPQVAERARDLASRYSARLTLIHVVEPVIVDSGYDLMTSIPVELDDTLIESGRAFLDRLVEDLQLGEVARRVELGSIKGELFRVVEEEAVDLVVIGTHGRHGIGLLLGSTANAILHGTPCDVHAVRIRKT
ncbi:MAG TPA: universal stress protein [Chromatiales bacterium]|nr:universal stress protein [Chromatiales bacterium]